MTKECPRKPNASFIKHTEVTHLARRECPYCGYFEILEICGGCVEQIEKHHRLDRKWICLSCKKSKDTWGLQVIGRV